MKSIKEKAKEWCTEHSNKGCKENCDGCWQSKQALGCEQHNMELAYTEGATSLLKDIEEEYDKDGTVGVYLYIKQLKEIEL